MEAILASTSDSFGQPVSLRWPAVITAAVTVAAMNLTHARRCVLYARLSVTKEESVSIARQLRSCRSYAEARGWEVVGEFVDDGVSATSNRPEDRKGWTALLAAGDFDAVIIWKVDRLARRVLDFLHADEALQARGGRAGRGRGPDRHDQPSGLRLRRDARRVRGDGGRGDPGSRARRAGAADQGPALRRRRGHLRLPRGGQPERSGTRARAGPRLHRLAHRGLSRARAGSTVNAVATWLTAAGAPIPAGGKTRRDAENRVWNRQTVEGLLRNRSSRA